MPYDISTVCASVQIVPQSQPPAGLVPCLTKTIFMLLFSL